MKRRQENHLSAQNNALTNRLGDDSQRNKVWQIDCQLIKKRSILDISWFCSLLQFLQHLSLFWCCFVEIVTTSQSINELNYFPNCDTLQARQPFGNYSVLLYLYFTVIIFLIRLLCVTYRFRTTLTKNKQQFETHGFGCVSQQNRCYISTWEKYVGQKY